MVGEGRPPTSCLVRQRRGWSAFADHDAEQMTMPDNTLRSATISVLVDNEAGVLARVIGLFSGRGYNIDSLTVAPVESEGGRSRINVVTSGTEMVIEQIKAQLDRLVPVHRVADLSREGPHIAREMALIKVVGQ